jgi:hypothetical protein
LFIFNWLKSHPSDHSAINHYYQIIISITNIYNNITQNLNNNNNNNNSMHSIEIYKLFKRIYIDNNYLISNRPGYESIWSLRRSFILLLLDSNLYKDIYNTNRKLFINNIHNNINNIQIDIKLLINDIQNDLLLILHTNNNDINNNIEGIFNCYIYIYQYIYYVYVYSLCICIMYTFVLYI